MLCLRYLLIAHLAFGLIGCASTPIPMASLNYAHSTTTASKRLLILLKGMGDSAKDIENAGFIDAIRDRAIDIDVIIPNAHFGYYKNKSLPLRLEEDFIQPAIDAGYNEIWLMGMSLGGLGSLLYSSCCFEKISGIILIAPYSGDSQLHEALAAQVALEDTQNLADKLDFDPDFIAVWQWLFDNSKRLQEGNIWLAHGDEDRLSGHELLASLLPKSRYVVIPGRHRLKVFKKLWETILSRSPFTQE